MILEKFAIGIPHPLCYNQPRSVLQNPAGLFAFEEQHDDHPDDDLRG